MFNIKEQLKLLPADPGVYLMKNKDGKVIYVGKAKILKNRVRQYFQSSKNHTEKVRNMVANIERFEYIITDTEIEALILECNLIKKYRPKYNVLLRDDKTYPYIKVTVNEDFPRILKVRQVKKDKAKYFGPFTNIGAVNDTLEIFKELYPIRICNINIEKAIKNNVRPCLNYHIGKCMAPCSGNVTKEQYGKMIEEVILFLSGKEDKLIEKIKLQMDEASSNLKFEEAAKHRDRLKSLETILEKQKIDKATNVGDQDYIAISKGELIASVQVFFVRNGKIVGRENYILEDVGENTKSEILSTFIKQFYINQDMIPKEIIVEEDFYDREIISQMLQSKQKNKIEIKIPQKGEKKGILLMVRKNADEYLNKFANLNRKKYKNSVGALETLKVMLDLEKIPKRIEAYDISNIQGVDSIGSMVVYTNGLKDKKEYRRYKIKTVVGPNDYDSMAEIIQRRLKYSNLPDLILLDGGKGQVSVVKKVLKRYNKNIPLWGMFKDDKHRTKGLVSVDNIEVEMEKTSEIYRFVASIQEEVHNYAITYHRSLRDKKMTKSVLDNISGVGEKRKKALMLTFKDVENIKKATKEELLSVEGINKNVAENIYNFFKIK